MNTVEIILACKCSGGRKNVRKQPKKGDMLYCLFHGNQRVEKVHSHEWRVRCSDCTFGRWTGQDEKAARRFGRKHREKHPTHFLGYAYDLVTPNGRGRILIGELDRPEKPATLDLTATPADNTPPPF